MNKLEIQGKVTQILTPESGTSKAGKEWKKQEFIIETDDQYPKKVAFTTFGDKTDLLMNISEGQIVDVSFNLESKEFNGRWFANVNAWRIVLTNNKPSNNDGNDLPPEFNESDEPPF